MVDVIGINYDEWYKKGKLHDESFLREWSEYIDFSIVLQYKVHYTDNFILELFERNRVNLYQLVIHNVMNKKLTDILKNQIEKYDDKYQVEYSYKYFPPIWEIIFKNIKNKKFKKEMFKRFISNKVYKYIKKSELKYIPNEVAGIHDK